MNWKRKFRYVLKKHMEAQWLRGQGNPSERRAPLKRYRNRGRPRELHDDSSPVTLADHWPDSKEIGE